jgi:peptidoglycan hydrolase CwlO-like protein
MPKKLDEYRTNITLHLTRISGDIEHIKEKVNSNNKHLEKINGRLRATENSISWIKGIGSTIAFVVSVLIGFLFKK